MNKILQIIPADCIWAAFGGKGLSFSRILVWALVEHKTISHKSEVRDIVGMFLDSNGRLIDASTAKGFVGYSMRNQEKKEEK